MYTEKTQQASLSRTIQSKPGGGRVYMEDNRPEAVGQAKMINEIEGCPNKDLPAQFYTIKKIEGKEYKCSENKNYITKGGEAAENVLYCKTIDLRPSFCVKARGGVKIEGYNAYKYSVQSGFKNDCGEFARILCKNLKHSSSLLYPRFISEKDVNKEDVVKYWEKNKIGIDGTDSQENKERRQDFSQNEATNPDVGEAYFMGRTRKFTEAQEKRLREQGECRHHVAAVIAKDGSDNITCEADAGKKDANEPVFDMYGTKTKTDDEKAQTFHFTYRELYSSEGVKEIPDHEAVTGVAGLRIKKRPHPEDSDDEVSEKKRNPN